MTNKSAVQKQSKQRLALALKRQRRQSRNLFNSQDFAHNLNAATTSSLDNSMDSLNSSFSSSSSSFSSSSNSLNFAPFTCKKSQRLSNEERAEMKRLASMLPNRMQTSSTQVLDPVQVINNTMQYISQLSATVMARVQNGSLPREALNQLPPYFKASLTTRRASNNQATFLRCRRKSLKQPLAHLRRI